MGRLLFHVRAFPSLNAGYAWILEAYGDALEEVAEMEAGKIQLWSEATRILTTMFGKDSEYVVPLEGKCSASMGRSMLQVPSSGRSRSYSHLFLKAIAGSVVPVLCGTNGWGKTHR